jgi:hypothetical protein
MTGAMDFSAHGVHARFQSGYVAVDEFLGQSHDPKPSSS